MRERHLVLAALVLVASACLDAGPSEPNPALGPLAGVYLNEAIDVIETNSIMRNEIDWAAYREVVLLEAERAGAESPAETHPMIVAALERLGDNHSFFRAAQSGAGMSPSFGVGQTKSRSSAGVRPLAHVLESGIAYLDVPAFAGGGTDADALSSSYHRLIRDIDEASPSCRWVVDLRGNAGGNMWPMLAGVGPILGEGSVGSFLYPDTGQSGWFYEGGQAGFDDLVIARADEPYTLRTPQPWVAVLTDELTASAGEAIAIAFRARERARSFGGPTWGVSTANAAFPLSDGSVIFLTVATMVDRAGTVYGGILEPDIPVPTGTKTGEPSTDAALSAALEWLEGRVCS
jgi:hypothetical protein